MQVVENARLDMVEIQKCAESMLDFAARHYNGGSDALRLLVVGVENESRWWDVFLDVRPRSDLCQTEYLSPVTADNWDSTDAFELVLQKAVETGTARLPGCTVEFREISLLENSDEVSLAASLVFGEFDAALAERVGRTRSNAVILLHEALIRQRAAVYPHYVATLLMHECLHVVEDSSELELIRDTGPTATFDKVTLDTFQNYVAAIGEDELKRKYPTLF